MKIHYFQRYHSKENVVTSNTLLMLSRLYNYNSTMFYDLLRELILKDSNNVVDLEFTMQVKGTKSVPDAIISQKSFKVIVETKLHGQFNFYQLINHLEGFNERSDEMVLLTLDPKPFPIDLQEKLNAYIKENCPNVKHTHLTFEDLINCINDIIDEKDREVYDVFIDFQDYCNFSGLLPNYDCIMRAIVCGTTLEENIKTGIYYDAASRNYSAHKYMGLYKNKRINAIGKIKKIVTLENGKYYEGNVEASLTKEEKDSINYLIQEAKENRNWDLESTPHNFFIVEEFVKINFKKSSLNPIQRSKFFDLKQFKVNGKLPDIHSLASILDGKNWSDYGYDEKKE